MHLHICQTGMSICVLIDSNGLPAHCTKYKAHSRTMDLRAVCSGVRRGRGLTWAIAQSGFPKNPPVSYYSMTIISPEAQGLGFGGDSGLLAPCPGAALQGKSWAGTQAASEEKVSKCHQFTQSRDLPLTHHGRVPYKAPTSHWSNAGTCDFHHRGRFRRQDLL